MSSDPVQQIRACLTDQTSYSKNRKPIIQEISKTNKVYIEALTDTVSKALKDKKEKSEPKFIALYLVKEAMDTKNIELATSVRDKLIKQLGEIAKSDITKYFSADTEDRIIKNFQQLLLECIQVWADWFGKDVRGKPSRFQTVYEEVAKKNKMPQKLSFFSNKKAKKPADDEESMKSQSIDASKSQAASSVKPSASDKTSSKTNAKPIATPGGNNDPHLGNIEETLKGVDELKSLLMGALSSGEKPDDGVLALVYEQFKDMNKQLQDALNELLVHDVPNKETILNRVLEENNFTSKYIDEYDKLQRGKLSMGQFRDSILNNIMASHEKASAGKKGGKNKDESSSKNTPGHHHHEEDFQPKKPASSKPEPRADPKKNSDFNNSKDIKKGLEPPSHFDDFAPKQSQADPHIHSNFEAFGSAPPKPNSKKDDFGAFDSHHHHEPSTNKDDPFNKFDSHAPAQQFNSFDDFHGSSHPDTKKSQGVKPPDDFGGGFGDFEKSSKDKKDTKGGFGDLWNSNGGNEPKKNSTVSNKKDDGFGFEDFGDFKFDDVDKIGKEESSHASGFNLDYDKGVKRPGTPNSVHNAHDVFGDVDYGSPKDTKFGSDPFQKKDNQKKDDLGSKKKDDFGGFGGKSDDHKWGDPHHDDPFNKPSTGRRDSRQKNDFGDDHKWGDPHHYDDPFAKPVNKKDDFGKDFRKDDNRWSDPHHNDDPFAKPASKRDDFGKDFRKDDNKWSDPHHNDDPFAKPASKRDDFGRDDFRKKDDNPFATTSPFEKNSFNDKPFERDYLKKDNQPAPSFGSPPYRDTEPKHGDSEADKLRKEGDKIRAELENVRKMYDNIPGEQSTTTSHLHHPAPALDNPKRIRSDIGPIHSDPPRLSREPLGTTYTGPGLGSGPQPSDKLFEDISNRISRLKGMMSEYDTGAHKRIGTDYPTISSRMTPPLTTAPISLLPLGDPFINRPSRSARSSLSPGRERSLSPPIINLGDIIPRSSVSPRHSTVIEDARRARGEPAVAGRSYPIIESTLGIRLSPPRISPSRLSPPRLSPVRHTPPIILDSNIPGYSPPKAVSSILAKYSPANPTPPLLLGPGTRSSLIAPDPKVMGPPLHVGFEGRSFLSEPKLDRVDLPPSDLLGPSLKAGGRILSSPPIVNPPMIGTFIPKYSETMITPVHGESRSLPPLPEKYLKLGHGGHEPVMQEVFITKTTTTTTTASGIDPSAKKKAIDLIEKAKRVRENASKQLSIGGTQIVVREATSIKGSYIGELDKKYTGNFMNPHVESLSIESLRSGRRPSPPRATGADRISPPERKSRSNESRGSSGRKEVNYGYQIPSKYTEMLKNDKLPDKYSQGNFGNGDSYRANTRDYNRASSFTLQERDLNNVMNKKGVSSRSISPIPDEKTDATRRITRYAQSTFLQNPHTLNKDNQEKTNEPYYGANDSRPYSQQGKPLYSQTFASADRSKKYELGKYSDAPHYEQNETQPRSYLDNAGSQVQPRKYLQSSLPQSYEKKDTQVGKYSDVSVPQFSYKDEPSVGKYSDASTSQYSYGKDEPRVGKYSDTPIPQYSFGGNGTLLGKYLGDTPAPQHSNEKNSTQPRNYMENSGPQAYEKKDTQPRKYLDTSMPQFSSSYEKKDTQIGKYSDLSTSQFSSNTNKTQPRKYLESNIPSSYDKNQTQLGKYPDTSVPQYTYGKNEPSLGKYSDVSTNQFSYGKDEPRIGKYSDNTAPQYSYGKTDIYAGKYSNSSVPQYTGDRDRQVPGGPGTKLATDAYSTPKKIDYLKDTNNKGIWSDDRNKDFSSYSKYNI